MKDEIVDQLAWALRVARAHLDAIACNVVDNPIAVARGAFDQTTEALDAYDAAKKEGSN